MNKVVLVFVMLSLLISISTFAYAGVDALDRDVLIEQVVDDWLAVAEVQYGRSMYVQAEQSLLRAQEYYEYLSPKQKQEVNDFAEKIYNTSVEKQNLLNQLESIDELIRQNQLLKAKAHLEQIIQSRLLNAQEQQKINDILKSVNTKIDMKKLEMAKLFRESQQYYEAGMIEEARSGFAEVASSGLYIPSKSKTAEQYLWDIEHRNDNRMILENQYNKSERQSNAPVKSKPLFWDNTRQDASGKTDGLSGTDGLGYEPQNEMKMQNHNELQANQYYPSSQDSYSAGKKIKSSYAVAIVRDSKVKVSEYLRKNELGQAKAVVIHVRAQIDEFKNDIDQKMYLQLMAELDDMADMILRRQESLSK